MNIHPDPADGDPRSGESSAPGQTPDNKTEQKQEGGEQSTPIYDRYDPPGRPSPFGRVTTYIYPGLGPRKNKPRSEQAEGEPIPPRITTYVFDPQYRRIVAVIEEGVRRELHVDEPGDKTL